MDRLRLLILFGGPSPEHPVSLKSAREVSKYLDSARYAPLFVYIQKDGVWLLVKGPDALDRGRPVAVSFSPRGLLCQGEDTVLPVDAALPMLHGAGGEDGAIQGLMKLWGVPCLGCSIAASVLAMDKTLCYLAAASAGVAVPRHFILEDGQLRAQPDLCYPLFVKPARCGSSFGVSKVTEPAKLAAAVAEAARFDPKVLLEEAVEGVEVGCAVLGSGRDLIVGQVDEIRLSSGFFRIHQEKCPQRGSENAQVLVPADIAPGARERVIESAKTVYRALGCEGLARVDLFLTPGGRVVLNEVNTMPGFTSYSRYPRMMAAAGLTIGQIIDRLTETALKQPQNFL